MPQLLLNHITNVIEENKYFKKELVEENKTIDLIALQPEQNDKMLMAGLGGIIVGVVISIIGYSITK